MVLDLKQVFDIPGEVLPIAETADFSGYEWSGVRPFVTPVTITGNVSNEAGIVMLRYDASFTLRFPCDRCLEEFDRDYHLSFEEVIVAEESAEHEEYIPAPGGQLDLDELCFADILLQLPTKQLCKEDCQGLCPVCGCNRNHTDCNCKSKEVDPRLAVLSELLD